MDNVINNRLRILVLEDNPDDYLLVLHHLEQGGLVVEAQRVDTPEAYLAGLESHPDLILADYNLPQFDALKAISLLHDRKLDIPVIVVSSYIGEELAVEAIKKGAADYLLKDRLTRLRFAIERCLNEKKLREDRSEIRQALRHSEALNRAVLSALTAHIAVLDRTGCIIQVNEAWNAFAVKNGDAELLICGPGVNYLDVCRSAYAEGDAIAGLALEGILSVIDKKTPLFTLEYPCTSDQQLLTFIMRVTPLDGGGAVVAHQDITRLTETSRKLERANTSLSTINEQLQKEINERETAERIAHQLNEALKHRIEELKKSNKELDEFAYAASHDLKAPLRAIENLSGWIYEDAHEILSEESKRHLDQLKARVERLDRLLDDLLKYSRADRIRSKVETINTHELVHEVVEMLSPPDDFTLIVAEDLPELSSERHPIYQVFLNLIGNAIKHHDKPRGCISISWEDLGTSVQFSVEDDGPGIPETHHDKIFQLFQTLKRRDEIEGSGMGLAIVKKILNFHGGTIKLQSEVGKGTSFQFTWPKEPVTVPPPVLT